jgi:parallel beta-helix repeat protein
MPAKLRLHAAPATVVSLAVILALTAAGLVAVSRASTARSRPSRTGRSAAAAAKQPKCGDTITTDTTLHKDLVNCPNNGILIGADNVTLDLNGHTIDGDGTSAAGCNPRTEFCDTGVANDGHDGVTVMHGSMRQLEAGVNFFRVQHNRLLGISTSRNRVVGIQFFGSSRLLVRNCSGNRTTAHEGAGLGLFATRHVRVLNGTFRHNAQHGIITADNSANNLIKRNVFSHNGAEAILLEGGESFQIRHNQVVRNGGGITLGPGSDNVIKRNHVSRARDGIRIEKGHGNLVAHNVVVHDRHAGIRLGLKQFRSSGGAHNVVRRNLVRDSRVDDFLVVSKARHSLLKGNVARGAGDDGFDIESRSIKLTRNLAVRNGDLGIEAVRGVNDGGGNVARHNGDPRQCTNIVCN